MSKQIPLTGKYGQGKFAIVDDDMFECISQWLWYCKDGYAIRSDRSTGKVITIRMHQLVLAAPSGMYVDHINRSRTDNRRCNLRIATFAQNMRNATKPPGKSVYRGVSQASQGWQASIVTNRNRIYLGYFSTKYEAAQAYNDAAIKHHGEFAILNDLSSGPLLDDIPLHTPFVASCTYRNVRKAKSSWQAFIYIDKKFHNLGRYSTPEDAAHAYDAFVKEHNLDRPLNFPD